MKNKIFISILVLCSVCSCDFLKETSQNLVKPQTVQEYKELLYGEVLTKSSDLGIAQYMDFMTDDVEDYNYYGTDPMPVSNDFREPMWSYYTWQQNPEIGLNNTNCSDDAWKVLYHRILMCNIFLDKIPTMIGSQREKEDIAGESYFMRALSYFMLANLYAAPYEEGTADVEACVPINTESGVDDRELTRASMREVYDLMESDIKASISHFKASGIKKTMFRPNIDAAYILASRIALFEKKYDDVINYCNELLKTTQAELYVMTSKRQKRYVFIKYDNPEIVFSYGKGSVNKYMQRDPAYKGTFRVSDELVNLFKEGDYRWKYDYIKNNMKQDAPYEKICEFYTPLKWYDQVSKIFPNTFRLSEAYLNRAEAYANKGDNVNALKDLNEIHSKRTKDGTYDSNPADVKQAIKDERRREFAFEGLRWFDIRRYGITNITHTYHSIVDEKVGDTYKFPGKESYILPVPENEKKKNLEIQIFPRPESKPINKK